MEKLYSFQYRCERDGFWRYRLYINIVDADSSFSIAIKNKKNQQKILLRF